MKTIDVIKENDTEKKKILNNSILNIVKNILKLDYEEGSLIEHINKIKYTKLYYFLKRIDYEGQLLWIY